MACTANVLLEVEDIVPHRFYYFIQARPGFEANGVEVQLHVDVRMRQKAGIQTTKLKSAKSLEVHPRKFIPSKYTRYTVYGHMQRIQQAPNRNLFWVHTHIVVSGFSELRTVAQLCMCSLACIPE